MSHLSHSGAAANTPPPSTFHDVGAPGAHHDSDAPRARLRLAFFIGALVLLVGGIALRQLAFFDHDVPPPAQLARDAAQGFGTKLQHESRLWQRVLQHHDAGERAWKIALFTSNGQLDQRVSSVGTILWQCAALAALLAALARCLRFSRFAWLAIASIAALLLPTLAALAPPTDAGGSSSAVFLSLVYLLLATRAAPRSTAWWLALAVGGLGIAWSTSALAAVAALTVWAAIGRRRDLLTANIGLLTAALALAFARHTPTTAGLASLGAMLAWPFSHAALAALVWLPSLARVAGWMKNRSTRSDTMPLLALWSLFHVGALALSGGDVRSGLEALLIGVVINAACLLSWPSADASARTRRFILAGAWFILIGDALINTPQLIPPAPDNAAAVLARPGLRDVLPPALRAPLELTPSVTTTSFAANAAPELPGRAAHPIVGTWSAKGGATTGEFTSTTMTSTFPWIQVRVAGTVRPPATSLVLRTANGKEIAPLETAFTATTRWKRVNFPTPAGPFQIVARDASPTEWIAITAPVEIGRWSRVAGKIPSLWPWLLGAAVVLATGVVVVRSRGSRAADSTSPFSAMAGSWKVVPWLAVFGYVLFFSHHVDTTAGPNDSGGYLNSAKLLVNGTTTATARMPAGVDLDRDVRLYMPITFHPDGERMVPEYPVGLPLEVWAVAQFTTIKRAVFIVLLLQLVLGIFFTQRLARAFGLPATWAWLAGGIVGLSPVYLFQGLQPQSDGPALVWVTAAVAWAWTSRERPWHAALAGLAVALAVLLRPSNTLCVLPVFLCLLGRGAWRRLIYCGLAGLPGIVWLMWYQHHLYGSWHTTGYGNVRTSFGLHFIAPTLQSYAKWLPEFFTPLVVLAFAAPFLRSVEGRARVVLTVWAGAFIAFYAVYWCTWDNWYNMRFVLPAAPAMVVMGLLVARQWLTRWRERSAVVAAWSRSWIAPALGFAAVFGFLIVPSAQRDVLYWMHNNHEHEVAATWVRDHVPANAVVFAKHATGSLFHYTELPFIRTDHEKVRTSTEIFDQLERAGRPIYALTYHWETAGYTWVGRGSGYPDLPGTWDRVVALWDADVMVWKRRPSLGATGAR